MRQKSSGWRAVTVAVGAVWGTSLQVCVAARVMVTAVKTLRRGMSGSFREELVEPSSISTSGVSINNWAREPGLPGVELSISARWVFGCYMNTEPIRVLAADDDALVREAYRSFFAAQPGIALVGQACDGQEVVEAFERILPDVTLIDLQMPVKSGIAATRQICAHWPRACVVVLTAFGTLEHIVAALKVGASGYLLKDAGLPALAAGIRQAARGCLCPLRCGANSSTPSPRLGTRLKLLT